MLSDDADVLYIAKRWQSAQFITDWKGRQYEHIEYTPYGELWIEEVAARLDKLTMPERANTKSSDGSKTNSNVNKVSQNLRGSNIFMEQ